MKIMKRLKKVWQLLFYNWKPLIGFELIYKAVSVVVFVPLLWQMFNWTMKISGYGYLTRENVKDFFLNPITIFALVLLLLLAMTYVMIDISAVIFLLDQSAQKNRVHLWQILKFAVKNVLRAWNPKNMLLIVLVLLFMPFFNISMVTSFLSTVSIPEFIIQYIQKNAVLYSLLMAVGLILAFFMTKWLYAFHYFTLEGCSFRRAQKKSSRLGRKKQLWDFLFMLLTQLAFALLYRGLVLLAVTVAVPIGKLFSNIFVLHWLTATAVWMALALVLAIIAALTLPVSYSCIGVLYYQHKAETGEKIVHRVAPKYSRNEKRVRFIHRCNIAIGCILVTGSLVLGFLLCSGKLNFQIEYVRTMEVTAHRGASAFYPENTMAAFEGAKELGADWIELDVQQAKDGQIIVMHDTNFKRTTGVDARTWDMTYEEIEKLDAGSFFSPDYAGEKIPLLTEVAAFAKENNIKLNIELKPTGHEKDFEKEVIRVIREAEIEDLCVITSQVYEALERVKAYDDSITTVYVMSFAYGDISQLTAADHFSVEAASATKSLVSRVHNHGKELFVWTVNKKDGINRMLEINVDNIITDDIALAKQCVYESHYSNWLAEYVKLLQ